MGAVEAAAKKSKELSEKSAKTEGIGLKSE
jgi:hypothetical protein